MALQYSGIDIMSLTKDLLDNPAGQTQIDNLIDAIVRDYPSISHIGVSIPMNYNSEATIARGSHFAIDPPTYAARFTDKIHNSGKSVLWRGTDCYYEGLYSFSKATKRNGNRYTFYGENITDDFSSTASRSHGYGKTSAAGNLSTNYLTSHQSGNNWTIENGELVGPEADGWRRTILFNAANLRDVTMVAKVKKVDNQQIVVRASTDSNNPGYGLQMRDSTILRIERPGLENLGEVSTKSWTTGSWYWLKLQAIGTAIKGKSWPDGTSEPAGWDIEITNSSYSNGYCGFSGESNNGKFDDMTITPEIDTDTWLYRAADWIRDNITLFENGDLIVPYPEAASHQNMTEQGTYNQFFTDLGYVIERIGRENSRNLIAKHFSHIWTSAIQNSYNDQFNEFGMATYDHYGTALGLGKRFSSFSSGSVGASNTYTVPTSITESATTRHDFIPEKVAYNTEIDVYIVDKGTGNWTMTIHDSSNNLVQMPDNTNFASKTNTGVVTISNASLTNNALNTFAVNWDNPAPDVTYHFHLTSTVGDGTVKTTTAGNLNTLYCNGYKGNASADAIEIDIRKTYSRTSQPQYLQEWGDYWSTDSDRSSPTRNQTQHEAYLDTIYAAMQRLVTDGILKGFNYWRALGGQEATMVDNDAGAGYDYQQSYEGVKLASFFRSNPVHYGRKKVSSRVSASTRTAI